ncbi:MAG: hypothetical protein ACFFB5_24805 [Promethearchaeota archaeon]
MSEQIVTKYQNLIKNEFYVGLPNYLQLTEYLKQLFKYWESIPYDKVTSFLTGYEIACLITELRQFSNYSSLPNSLRDFFDDDTWKDITKMREKDEPSEMLIKIDKIIESLK